MDTLTQSFFSEFPPSPPQLKPCACNKCQCSTHTHNKVVQYEYIQVRCRGASVVKCTRCSKMICELCWNDHKRRHLTV